MKDKSLGFVVTRHTSLTFPELPANLHWGSRPAISVTRRRSSAYEPFDSSVNDSVNSVSVSMSAAGESESLEELEG